MMMEEICESWENEEQRLMVQPIEKSDRGEDEEEKK